MREWRYGTVVVEKGTERLFFIIANSRPFDGSEIWQGVLLAQRGIPEPAGSMVMLWHILRDDPSKFSDPVPGT